MRNKTQLKSGGVTAILNALIPGLGFLYLGKVGLFFLALIVTAIASVTIFAGLALWALWIFISFPMTKTWNCTYVPGYEKQQQTVEFKETRKIIQKVDLESEKKRKRKMAIGFAVLCVILLITGLLMKFNIIY